MCYSSHCVKSARIRKFPGPYFPAFGLNSERYSVTVRIQSKYGKIWTRKIAAMDTFHAVCYTDFFIKDLPTSNNPNGENHKKLFQNKEKAG